MIIDDEWALIGSANAGGISLEGIRTGRNQPDTELSAIILDKKFAANFRKILWEEHLGMKVSSTYEPRDADKFRRLAAQPFHKIRFFPGYDKIKKPKSTEDIPISLIKKYSRIIPSFPDWWRDSLPVALMTATFQACVVPPAPPGYRCYYRWRCELFHGREIPTSGRIGGEGFRMRGIKLDEVLELGDYTDQDIAYIGKMTADSINSKVKDVEDGRILCRVQIVPLAEGPDPSNEKFPSFLLEYNCQFMNSELAKANLEPGRLP